MIKKGWLVLLPVMALLSCKHDAHQSLQSLQLLSGNWVSSGNTIIYQKWKAGQNELSGFSYSLKLKDTLFINCFKIKVEKDKLLLLLSPCKTKVEPKVYRQTKEWFGKYTFEAEEETYPFKISIDLINDTLWRYKQENIRGNKVIEFKMRKISL